jgi:hypothetical protein
MADKYGVGEGCIEWAVDRDRNHYRHLTGVHYPISTTSSLSLHLLKVQKVGVGEGAGAEDAGWKLTAKVKDQKANAEKEGEDDSGGEEG